MAGMMASKPMKVIRGKKKRGWWVEEAQGMKWFMGTMRGKEEVNRPKKPKE